MTEYAYLAGGCFWCITPVLDELNGVSGVTAGYCGGSEENPSYEQVKSRRTGHRETVRVAYDPSVITYRRILETFFANVDLTDGGGQFIDRGHSYTLAVYYETAEQQCDAEELLSVFEASSGRKPCVSVEPFSVFWEAEEYHQNYYRTHPVEFAEELQKSGRVNPAVPQN